jgi:hypothetical protein
MNETSREENRFVQDGRARALDANERLIRANLEQQFAAEMAKAGWWGRLMVRRRIDREVKRQLELVAPRHGLY